MLLFLRAFFIIVIASMLAVTSWASLRCPLFAIPHEVYAHPWFIATLFDAYWGFMTFYLWVAYKQTTAIARAGWFIAILLLGNIAMAAYCLSELFHVPRDSKLSAILTVRNSGPGSLGLILAALGVAVLILA